MQTFLSSHRSLSRAYNARKARGFTLIELLISAGIITIISGIVLVRFGAYDSSVVLKNAAYEVAASIRQAQIYSISVVNIGTTTASSNFRYPYGVSFTPGSRSYTLFRFNNTDPDVTPRLAGTVDHNVLLVSQLPGSIIIADVCIDDDTSNNCSPGRLDVSFRRPEYAALFWRAGGTGTGAISAGRIKLQSTRDTSVTWVVEVTLLGQINVYRE